MENKAGLVIQKTSRLESEVLVVNVLFIEGTMCFFNRLFHLNCEFLKL